MKNADSINAMMTTNYSKYNESGYPTEFTTINNSLQHDTVTGIFFYQCK